MKLRKLFAAVLLSLILIISGTIAWRDVSQHKTNRFKTNYLVNSVVLVEDFEEVNRWSVLSDPIKKKVTVRNGNAHDDIKNFQYEDAFVRLQLREFMAIMKTTPITSNNRYMIDNKGDFVKGLTENEALVNAQALNPNINKSDLEQIVSYSDSKEISDSGGYWYIKTNAESINGAYGKFLITDVVDDPKGYISQHSGDPVDISELDNSVIDHHNDLDDKEIMEDLDPYKTHTWDQVSLMSNSDLSIFQKYVKMNFGSDLITYGDWLNSGAKVTKKWILDTNSPDGWVYWGTKLRHDIVGDVAKGTETNPFLESVQLIENPDGKMIYRIHVNMDAISIFDLEKWDNVPYELLEAYKGDLINWEPLIQAVEAAELKLEKATRLERYVKGSRENLLKVLKDANTMLSLYEEDDQEVIDDQTDLLLKAIEQFRLNLNYEGELAVNTRIKDFAGKNWTIVHIDENNNALLIADPFTESELAKLGIQSAERDKNKLFFNSGKFDYGNGYNSSILKKANDAFYNMNIKGKQEASFIEPVVLKNEPAMNEGSSQSDIYNRVDGASVVSKSGKEQVFTLSLSDWNAYVEPNTRKQVLGRKRLWTTTPGIKNQDGLVTSVISISTNNN